MFSQDNTCPDLLESPMDGFRVPGYHCLWLHFPEHSTNTPQVLGLVPVSSPLLRESRLISFPPGT